MKEHNENPKEAYLIELVLSSNATSQSSALTSVPLDSLFNGNEYSPPPSPLLSCSYEVIPCFGQTDSRFIKINTPIQPTFVLDRWRQSVNNYLIEQRFH